MAIQWTMASTAMVLNQFTRSVPASGPDWLTVFVKQCINKNGLDNADSLKVDMFLFPGVGLSSTIWDIRFCTH